MTLAQVQAVVGIITLLIGSWTALLIAVSLTLPERTALAEAALRNDTKRCFGRGLLLLIPLILGVVGLGRPPLTLPAILLLLVLAAVFTVGAAGLSKLMGARMAELAGQTGNSFGNLTKGSLVYSVALLFPLIGWYLFLPLSTLAALGAGTRALWPKRKTAPTVPPLPNQPAMDYGL